MAAISQAWIIGEDEARLSGNCFRAGLTRVKRVKILLQKKETTGKMMERLEDENNLNLQRKMLPVLLGLYVRVVNWNMKT